MNEGVFARREDSMLRRLAEDAFELFSLAAFLSLVATLARVMTS